MRILPGIWNLVFLATFFFAFYNQLLESEAHSDHHKKLSSAVVVGTVYCETCFHQEFSKSSHFISGATVAVECRDRSANNSRLKNFRELLKTNDHGEFKVHLPFSVSKHVKKIKACSVKLISSSEPFCAVASTATSSLLRLKSRKEGTHIFSAGFFTFKPLKQPLVCDQKPSINNLEAVDSSASSDPNDPAFLPPIRDPPSSSSPDLPSIPNLPDLPGIPTLPPLPVPQIPAPTEESRKISELTDKQAAQQIRPPGFFPFLPPNPLLPPPSILPPVLPTPPPSILPPIFPSPPPSVLPPIFPSPPSPPRSILPPLIPLPGLNPPPPPPAAPSFPFPIPLPPGFPGVPPASEPKQSHP